MSGRYYNEHVCYYYNPIYPADLLLSYDGLLYDVDYTDAMTPLVNAYYMQQRVKHGGAKDIAHNGRYSAEDVEYIAKVLTARASR